MKKILVVTPTYFPIMGGAETGIYEIFRRMTTEHQVKILTPLADKNLTQNFGMEEDGFLFSEIEVLRYKDRLNLKRWPGHGRLKGAIPPFSFSAIPAVLKLVKAYKPDVVNVFYPLPTGLAAVILEKIKKIPVVLSLVGRDVPGPGIPRFWGNYSRAVTRSISETIFISDYCRKALFGTDSGKYNIVPFGVDVDRFKPGIDGNGIRKSLNIPTDAKILFSLQRLDRWKRADVLIEAMRHLPEKKKVFLVIGGKGPEKEHLEREAARSGLSSRIIFTGYIKEKELPLYYAMADIFVFHSIYETLGLVLLQALASGNPVVSVNSTAIPEVIDKNKNGLLVDPLNPEEFAQAIISLLENKETMKKFSIESRKKALREYDWARITAKYLEIFLRCIKKRKDSMEKTNRI